MVTNTHATTPHPGTFQVPCAWRLARRRLPNPSARDIYTLIRLLMYCWSGSQLQDAESFLQGYDQGADLHAVQPEYHMPLLGRRCGG